MSDFLCLDLIIHYPVQGNLLISRTLRVYCLHQWWQLHGAAVEPAQTPGFGLILFTSSQQGRRLSECQLLPEQHPAILPLLSRPLLMNLAGFCSLTERQQLPASPMSAGMESTCGHCIAHHYARAQHHEFSCPGNWRIPLNNRKY